MRGRRLRFPKIIPQVTDGNGIKTSVHKSQSCSIGLGPCSQAHVHLRLSPTLIFHCYSDTVFSLVKRLSHYQAAPTKILFPV